MQGRNGLYVTAAIANARDYEDGSGNFCLQRGDKVPLRAWPVCSASRHAGLLSPSLACSALGLSALDTPHMPGAHAATHAVFVYSGWVLYPSFV